MGSSETTDPCILPPLVLDKRVIVRFTKSRRDLTSELRAKLFGEVPKNKDIHGKQKYLVVVVRLKNRHHIRSTNSDLLQNITISESTIKVCLVKTESLVVMK